MKLKSLLILAISGLAMTACIAPNPMILPNGNGSWDWSIPEPEPTSSGSQSSSIPSSSGSESSSAPSSSIPSSSSSQSSSSSSSQEESKITVRFYLDYSNSDENNPWEIVVVDVNSLLTEPKTPTASDCPDPAFPTFLGWSKQPLLDSTEGLWNFATDLTPDQKFLSIYGIWVCAE